MVVPTRVLLWFFAESVAGGAPLTVVSAANGRYALKEIAVMLEVGMMSRRENIETRLIAYNLGGGWCPPGRERTRLYEEFGIEYRDFDFSKYPRHVSNLGCYAWKAPMVVEVARQVGNESVVMWIDSGVAFHQSVKSVITATRRNLGFVSDSTSFSIARFSHERMLDYFVENLSFNATYAQQLVQKRRSGSLDSQDGIDATYASFKNCNGAFSAHLYGSPKFAAISERWLECSLQQSCVCPRGSNRNNHRQDQAALTLLAVANNYVCGSDGKFVSAHGLRNHQVVLQKFGIKLGIGEAQDSTPNSILCSNAQRNQSTTRIA